MISFQRIPAALKSPFFGPEFVIEGYKTTYDANPGGGGNGGGGDCLGGQIFNPQSWTFGSEFAWSNGVIVTQTLGEVQILNAAGTWNESGQPTPLYITFTCDNNYSLLRIYVFDDLGNTIGDTLQQTYHEGESFVSIDLTYPNPLGKLAQIQIVCFDWSGSITNIAYPCGPELPTVWDKAFNDVFTYSRLIAKRPNPIIGTVASARCLYPSQGTQKLYCELKTNATDDTNTCFGIGTISQEPNQLLGRPWSWSLNGSGQAQHNFNNLNYFPPANINVTFLMIFDPLNGTVRFGRAIDGVAEWMTDPTYSGIIDGNGDALVVYPFFGCDVTGKAGELHLTADAMDFPIPVGCVPWVTPA